MNGVYFSFALIAAGALLASGLVFHSGAIVGASSNTGILVPLYTYPGATWSEVTQAKQAYPSVPFLVIVNPNSGVGTFQDPDYVTGVRNLQGAGIIVLGYVWTDYGQRPVSAVESEMQTYKSWYNVNGVFLDGADSISGGESYYSALSSYASSIGLSNTVENQGAATPSSYIGTGNLIIPYEGSGLPSVSSLSQYPRTETAVIAYSVPSLDTSWIGQAKFYTSYVYVTDAGLPNPYGALPSYFMQEVAALAADSTQTYAQMTTVFGPTATTTETINGPTTTETVQGPTTVYTTTLTAQKTTGPGLSTYAGLGLMAVGGLSVFVTRKEPI